MSFKVQNVKTINISEEEYRKVNAYSFSSLPKGLDVSLSSGKHVLKKREAKTQFWDGINISISPSIVVGSIVDMFVTDKGYFDQDTLNNNLIVSNNPFLRSSNMQSRAIKSIGYLFEDKVDYSAPTPGMEKMAREADIYLSKRNLANFKRGHYNADRLTIFQNASLDRNLVQEAFDLIHKAKTSRKFLVTEHQKSMLYPLIVKGRNILNKFTEKVGGTKTVFQLKIFCTLDSCVHMKSMLDVVVVNEKTKELYPVDIKTGIASSDVTSFLLGSYLEYSYYLQAALYRFMLHQLTKRKESIFYGYKVKEFTFLYLPYHAYINGKTFDPFEVKITDKMYANAFSAEPGQGKSLQIDVDSVFSAMDPFFVPNGKTPIANFDLYGLKKILDIVVLDEMKLPF